MTKRELIALALRNCTDEAERKRLNEEMVKAIEEETEARVRAEIEAEQKAAKERAAQTEAGQRAAESAFAGVVTASASPRIEVLDHAPSDYKGFNLKKTLDWMQSDENMHVGMRSRAKQNPKAATGVIKLFADMIRDSIDNPIKGLSKAAMQEGTDAEGGYLVPTEQRFEILAYVREQSVALRNVTRINMTSDSMTLPRELTTVTVAYTAEETAATESDPTLDQVTLTAKRMDAYSVTSNELLQDAANPGGIVGLLMSQFMEAIGQKVDSTVFIGSGDPISGVFLSTGYSTVFSSGSTHFSELLEANLRNIVGKISAARLVGASWYGHRTPVWDYVYGLKDSNGRNLFIPDNTESASARLIGWPLQMPEQAKSTSAVSTAMLVFGNLRGFWVGDRLTRINLFVDPYSKSTSYQTMFLLFTRWAYAHALPNMYGRVVTAAA